MPGENRGWTSIALAAIAAAGCADGRGPGEAAAAVDPGGAGPAAGPTASPAARGETTACAGPYLPLTVGSWWTYRVTGPTGALSMKTQRVVRVEPVPVPGPHRGKSALRLETRKGPDDFTVSWMTVEGARAVRHAEESFRAGTTTVSLRESWQPARLRLDESPPRLVPRASWREDYVEAVWRFGGTAESRPHTEIWTVEAADEPCAVPGKGSFACVRVGKAGPSGDGKVYWFARCIGKVKETGRHGVGQTEELVDFAVVR